ncbi:MAG: catalase [Mycoplasma sp.]
MKDKKILTTQNGSPIHDNQNSKSTRDGQILLEDFQLIEKLAHFARERIPERVVHAVGAAAFGTFKLTNPNLSQYTKAKLFTEMNKETEVFLRFSTVAGSKGSADTVRDVRGFALRFFTEEGNYDIVGNNTPVFFIRDAKKFPDFIHTQKPDPITNLPQVDAQWDFWTSHPEAFHQVLILFSNRGTPYGYRFMNGFGSHTFSWINNKDEKVFVKYHFITKQGIKNMSASDATTVAGIDPQFSQRDLVDSIEKGDCPTWTVKVQIMTEEQSRNYKFNPFDVTKVWYHADFPLIEVGEFTLNKNVGNFFAQTEQATFTPANIVPGIGFSPDKLLQGRLFSYGDAHRYRVGTNHNQLPINQPKCPMHSYDRDGAMATNQNTLKATYEPNTVDNYGIDKHEINEAKLNNDWIGYFDQDEDYYTQPAAFINVLRKQENEYESLVNNISNNLKNISKPLLEKVLEHFKKIDSKFAEDIKVKTK